MGKKKTTEETTSRFCPQCFESFPPHLEECPEHGAALVGLSDEQKSLVGRTFDGKYEMLELLGVGGMGTVYRARQMPIDREVALKLLNKDYLRDKMGVKRFVQEAQAASMLKSRYSAMIFDFGLAAEGYLYYTMELAVGALLTDAIKDEGRLDLERTLHIGMDICRSLEEAHSHGIVHRDLKPDNIMLAEMDGHEIAKVLDFGTAKLIGTKKTTTLTEVGKVAGTPEYMSPEQAQAKSVDGSTDLYSLGVVMYEMLSGKPPFLASSSIAVLIKHVNDKPLPLWEAAHDANIPAEVSRFVMKLLSKDPAKRPGDAVETRQVLEGFLARFGAPLTGGALKEHLHRHDLPSGGNMLLFDRSAHHPKTEVDGPAQKDAPARESVPEHGFTQELEPGKLWGASEQMVEQVFEDPFVLNDSPAPSEVEGQQTKGTADTILSNAADAPSPSSEEVDTVRTGGDEGVERVPTTVREKPVKRRWFLPAASAAMVLLAVGIAVVSLPGRNAEKDPVAGVQVLEPAPVEPVSENEAPATSRPALEDKPQASEPEQELPPEGTAQKPAAETTQPVAARTDLMQLEGVINVAPVLKEMHRVGPVPKMALLARAADPRKLAEPQGTGGAVESAAMSGIRVARVSAPASVEPEQIQLPKKKQRKRSRKRVSEGSGVNFSPDDLQ